MSVTPYPAQDLGLPSVELGALLEHALHEAKEWQHQVGDGFAALNSHAEYELRMRTRALLTEHETVINSTEPRPIAAVDAALRERLVVEAQQAYWDLYQGVCAVAERVAETLGSRTPHHFPGLPVVAPEQLVAGLTAPRPPRPGTPLPARVLKVFRPGWSGIMMALIATKLLDIHLPGVVMATIALVGALVLGGAALTGERKRQKDRLRGEAVAALRSTVEDFRLTLSKQLRDASRALQRDLRRASAAAAADRVADLNAELKMIRSSRPR